jgi:hypothetical protein
VLVAPLAAAAVPLPAEATLAGTVHDPSGAVIAGAVVTLAPLRPAGSRVEDATDSTGGFRLADLCPARYRLVVSASGFEAHVVETSVDAASGILGPAPA